MASKGTASYQNELRGLIAKYHVPISAEDTRYCQLVYEFVFEERLRLERDIAKLQILTPNSSRIEIPPYAEGEKLRSILENEITETVGIAAATLLFTKAGAEIDNANANWGHDTQLLDVTFDPDNSLYEIHHGTSLNSSHSSEPIIRVSNSVLRSNQLDKYSLFKSLFPNS